MKQKGFESALLLTLKHQDKEIVPKTVYNIINTETLEQSINPNESEMSFNLKWTLKDIEHHLKKTPFQFINITHILYTKSKGISLKYKPNIQKMNSNITLKELADCYENHTRKSLSQDLWKLRLCYEENPPFLTIISNVAS